MTRLSARLRRLELDTRRLLARAGRIAAEYDSARLSDAIGDLDLAADEFHQAAIVCAATEKREA